MKATPAPWELEEDKNGENWIRCGEHLTLYLGDIEDICGECLADGRLIAAAPSLLEACEAADEFLVDIDHIGPGEEEKDYMAVKAKLRDALRKAKGE